MTTTLVGMFYIRHAIDFYHTGEVIGIIGTDLLMQPDTMNPDLPQAMPMFVTSMLDITDVTDALTPQYEFFRTRVQLDAYIKWMDSPSSPAKVFSLVPKAKEE